MFKRAYTDWLPAAAGVVPQGGGATASVAARLFENHFELVRATTPGLKDIAHRLRYRIYCEENPFECRDDHPDRMERDRFDSHARHVLLRYRKAAAGEDSFIGVVRIILSSGREGDFFPVQSAIQHPFFEDVDRMHGYCEVSRLGVIEQFRRAHRTNFVMPGLSLSNLAPIGLIRGAAEESLMLGLNRAVLIVKDNLRQSLERIGVQHYDRLGEPVEHKGLRQALAMNYTENFVSVRQKCPRLWDIISRDGVLETQSRAIDFRTPYSLYPPPSLALGG